MVLKPAGGELFALAVDRIHDHEELVVKPAAPAVMATGLYAGTTLADDGSPILLFDPAGLAEVGGIRLEMQERASRVVDGIEAAPVVAEIPVLLFRGLDGARRAIRLGIVDRIEEVPAAAIRHGAGQLRVQLGEAILPLAGVPDGTKFEGKVRLFRLNDGAQQRNDADAVALRAAQPVDGRPTSLDRVLAIGDSVRTDLTGALGFGIDCLFLTRGIHSEEFEGIDQLEEAPLLDGEIARNAQAQVVDQPAIDQMDMRTSRPIHVGARLLEADETVATPGHHPRELRERVRVQGVGVDQQDLRNLAPEERLRLALEVVELRLHVRDVRGGDPVGDPVGVGERFASGPAGSGSRSCQRLPAATGARTSP